MSDLRLATWNVEWFNALFDDDGALLDDEGRSARHDVSRAEQIAAVGAVFRAMDADGILVIEAPDQGGTRRTVPALEGFARAFGLRARRAVVGFASETEQEIAFLYDPDRLVAVHDPQGPPVAVAGATPVPRFDGTFLYDLGAGAGEQAIRLSKPPLELAITPAEGVALRLIGVHAKSKAPHGARNDADVRRIGIENRRKQLAECLWVRGRAEELLAAGTSLIVAGDLNDGPGLDEYETLFGRSGVEIVLGAGVDPARRLYDPHALMALTKRLGLVPTTARFWLAPQKRFFEALLDFVMVSPDLAAKAPVWRIWHPLNDPGVAGVPGLAAALLAASDHFPVTLDLPL